MRLLGFKFTIFVFAVTLLCGCVSVNLGAQKGPQRAVGVIITPPASPFNKVDQAEVDGAWMNSSTGNLISYLTDCQDTSDPSLESIVQGALRGLNELNVEATNSPTVQGREGRRVVATGKVDGVVSKIDLLAFKRNQCIYMLSYVGVQNSFPKDLGAFNKFVAGFRAP